MNKLKLLFFPTILVLAFGLMLSCAKSSEDNINDGVANTNENLEGTLEDNNDTALDLEDALTGGGGSNDSGGGSGEDTPIIHTKLVKEIIPGIAGERGVIWELI